MLFTASSVEGRLVSISFFSIRENNEELVQLLRAEEIHLGILCITVGKKGLLAFSLFSLFFNRIIQVNCENTL